MFESLFNKVAGLRPPSHVLHDSSMPQHIASYYGAPIFLEDLAVNASIFRNLFTLT